MNFRKLFSICFCLIGTSGLIPDVQVLDAGVDANNGFGTGMENVTVATDSKLNNDMNGAFNDLQNAMGAVDNAQGLVTR